MDNSNTIIHGLWIGDYLSPLEMLTLHSFIEQGHTFHLWLYEPLQNELPQGVICQDANSIIPQSEIFVRQKGDPHKGFGKGSLALFSDLFRYKLLYEKGGWWVDMDITCIQAFEFEAPYFFRAHPLLPMVGNVMKCPRGAPVMLATYEAVKERCNANTKEWLLSNKILNEQVQNFNLAGYIKSGYSNPDDWLEIERLLYAGFEPQTPWKYIHWMNEEWRSRAISKEAFFKNSYLETLYKHYNLSTTLQPLQLSSRIKYRLKEVLRYSHTGFRKIVPKKT